MVNPVSSSSQLHATDGPKPPKPRADAKTPPAQQKNAPQPSDIVTLKSTGGVDRDADKR
jgi:hypothetical protein